jgi:hypothetical protein
MEQERSEKELQMFTNLKAKLPELKALQLKINSEWGYEDHMYRFYHQSFKVYSAQEVTTDIVKELQSLLPQQPLNEWFMAIVERGTGKMFAMDHNQRWLAETLPIVEALNHSKYFLDMAVKYGQKLKEPQQWMSAGWASLLTLYGIR